MTAIGKREGVGHCTANQHSVTDAKQVVDDIDFITDFGTTQDCDKRSTGIANRITEVLNFASDQVTHDAGLAFHCLGNRNHGCIAAVTSAEGIIAVAIGKRGQFSGELCTAFFLTRVEPQILEDQNLPIIQCTGFGDGVVTNSVRCHGDGLSQHLGQAGSGRCQAELGLKARPCGTAHMAHQNQFAASVDHALDAGQRHSNAAIISDFLSFIQRHIEVDSHQDCFASNVNLVDRFFCHFWSSRRFTS